MTIPQQIEQEKTPYYKALEAADNAWAAGRIDLMAMKGLLGAMLAKQLHVLMNSRRPAESRRQFSRFGFRSGNPSVGSA